MIYSIGVSYFASLIGDYETLLSLQDSPPYPLCPSMNDRTLVPFLRFKTGKAGTPLVDDVGKAVKDVNGKASQQSTRSIHE